MELRYGRTVKMTVPQSQFTKAVASLTKSYEHAKTLMCDSNNVNEIKNYLPKVNSAYNNLISLCSKLSESDFIPGTSLHKLDFDSQYWDFKMTVQEWIDYLATGNVEIGPSDPSMDLALGSVEQGHKDLPVEKSTVSIPVSLGATFMSKIDSQVTNPIELTQAAADGSTTSHPPDLPLFQSLFFPTSTSSTSFSVPSYEKDVLPYQNLTSKKLLKSSRSKKSRASSITSSASRLEEAQIKLEIAQLQQLQNEERRREEEQIQLHEEEMKQQIQRQAELKRQNQAAEDKRQIEIAKLEIELRQANMQYDDQIALSSQSNASVALYKETKLFRSLSKPSLTTTSESFQPKFSYSSAKLSYPELSVQERLATSRPISTARTYANPVASQHESGSRYYAQTSKSFEPARFASVRDRKHVTRDFRSKLEYSRFQPEVRLRAPVSKHFESTSYNRQMDPTSKFHTVADTSEQYLPKPSIKKFEGDPLDYWAFLNRFRSHIGDWLSPKRRLSYPLQHCSAEVVDNIQHCADIHDGQNALDTALEELKRRYGQPCIIARACEQRLSSFPKLDKDVAERLNKLSILMKRCCHALADEQIALNLDSVSFLVAIANKLTIDLKRKWIDAAVNITRKTGRNASFKDLTQFVDEQAKIANSTFGLNLFGSNSSRGDQPKRAKTVALQTTTKTENKTGQFSYPKPKCPFCSETHKLYKCEKFRGMAVTDRSQFVKKNKICERCLNSGHATKFCTLKYIKCRKQDCDARENHNTLLHPVSNTSSRSLSEDIAASSSDSLIDSKVVKSLTMSSNSSCATSKTRSYLDVIPVKVNSNGKSICTYALLDTGSERTFCEQRLVDEMNPCNSHVKLAIQTLSTGDPHVLDTIAVSFSISSLDDSYSMNLADVVVVESIPVAPTVMPNLGDLQRHSHLSDVSLTEVKGGSVTLLIGNDHAAAHRCLRVDSHLLPKQVLMPC